MRYQRLIGISAIGLAIALTPLAHADQNGGPDQSGLWRCPGNVFTNTPTAEQKRSGCVLVESQISVVEPKANGGSAANEVRSRRDQKRDEAEQRKQEREQKEADAQQEKALKQAQQELAALKAEYNNGQPGRLGDERNYQKYLDRVERLKNEIAAKEAEISGLQGERR